MSNNFTTLDKIVSQDTEQLTSLKQGAYETEKLGLIPYTAIDHPQYKKAKKACVKMIPNGTGGMDPDVDDDKLMVQVIIDAVDKDERSDFTFASKQLIEKLNEDAKKKGKSEIISADQVVSTVLSPGEIVNFAIEIQGLSGFSQKAKKEQEEEVKN